MNGTSTIQGKDLINVGIYCAIYCVIMTLVSMLGFVPIFLVLLPLIVPILCSIPMMLFMTKVKKFGMVTLMAILIGIFLFITGMGYWALILGIVCGVAADYICKSGNYSSIKMTVLANGVFHIMIFGALIPLYMDLNGYFATHAGFGADYIASLTSYMQPWTAPALALGAFIAGVLGALLGVKVLSKKFASAGIK